MLSISESETRPMRYRSVAIGPKLCVGAEPLRAHHVGGGLGGQRLRRAVLGAIRRGGRGGVKRGDVPAKWWGWTV